MKKWENPQLSLLGIEKTKSSECACITNVSITFGREDLDKNLHFCHRDNMWHQNNCMSLHEGHDQSAKCPTGGNHEWLDRLIKVNVAVGGLVLNLNPFIWC